MSRLIVAALVALLPAGFRNRQRGEWLSDISVIPVSSRPRYLAAALITLPALRAAARRRPQSSPYPVKVGHNGRTLVALFALAAGLFGAAVAGRLVWTPPGPVLSASASQALNETVFPGRDVSGSPDARAFETDGDDRTRPGGALFEVAGVSTTRDLRADAITARDRLIAAGWTIDDDVHYDLDPATVDVNLATDTSWAFTAHTDELRLEFGAWRYGPRAASSYGLSRTWYPHAPTLVLVAAGLPAGLAGLLAARRLTRRVAGLRNRAAVRAAIPTVALFALAPAVFLLANRLTNPIPAEPSSPTWYTLFVKGADTPYFYAATITILAVGLALLPTIREPIRAQPWGYAES